MTFFRLCLLLLCITVNSLAAGKQRSSISRTEYIRKKVDVMKQYMNPGVDPCKNMYEYACGNFRNVHKIPRNKVFVRRLSALQKGRDKILKRILESSSGSPPNTASAKLKRFYDSCMDETTIRSRGIQPMLELFTKLGGWPMLQSDWDDSNFRLENILADLSVLGYQIPPHISFTSSEGGRYILNIGIGDINIYGVIQKIYAQSKGHMYYFHILRMLGLNDIDAILESRNLVVMDKIFIHTENRAIPDPRLITVGHLQKHLPNFDLRYFLERTFNTTISESLEISISDFSYTKSVLDFLQIQKPKVIVNWLFWRAFHRDVPTLWGKFTATATTPRYEFCQTLAVEAFPRVMSAEYIKLASNKRTKPDVQLILDDIRTAFQEAIQDSQWLLDETKILAVEKVASIDFIIGYNKNEYLQDKIQEEYADYEIHAEKFYENTQNIRKSYSTWLAKRLGERIDYSDLITPLDMNAFYNVLRNQVQIPTAFLQVPLYDRRLPKAMNYGAMGAVIGHEMGHALDNTAKSYDKEGSPNEWWDSFSKIVYSMRSKCFQEQYDKYKFKNMSVDGSLTFDENLSDNTGLRSAYFGYMKWMERNRYSRAMEREQLPGIDLDRKQLFFLAFAQTWCVKVRTKFVPLIMRDQHSPEPVRVNAALSNFDEFSTAFGCKIGTKMNPRTKCKFW